MRYMPGETTDLTESDELAENVPALSIGVVFGGTHQIDKFWDQPIKNLRRQVMSSSESFDSPLKVNIVYHIAGKYASNEFEGVRTGRFFKSVPLLIVQAAVPSDEVDDPQSIIVELLHEAISVAEQYAKKKGIATQLTAVRGIADKLGES